MAEITYFVVVPFQETENGLVAERGSSAHRNDRPSPKRGVQYPRARWVPSPSSALGIPTLANTARQN